MLSAKAIGDLKEKFDKDKDKKLSLSEFKGLANDISKKQAALLCLAAVGICFSFGLCYSLPVEEVFLFCSTVPTLL